MFPAHVCFLSSLLGAQYTIGAQEKSVPRALEGRNLSPCFPSSLPWIPTC